MDKAARGSRAQQPARWRGRQPRARRVRAHQVASHELAGCKLTRSQATSSQDRAHQLARSRARKSLATGGGWSLF
ncbi:UNVERIFIED_CONTAM: hypothetical protein Slati_1125100 [Sesamum latifolium]|uniref:Uncharacterized protein n=1 Tax=Sesamum latifolium TaxID=2727402 RepID=A0AAW2XHV8_9LAMI